MQRRLETSPCARGRRLLAGAAGLLLGAGLAACEPYVEGNGVLREEVRDLPAFVGVVISDGIQAAVTAGAAEQLVRVSGDENVLDFVETVVSDRAAVGRVLEVKTASSYQSKNPLRVAVSIPILAFVSAKDAAPVTIAGAAAPAFTVEAVDGSHLVLAGGGGERLVVTLGGGQHGGASLDARGYPVATAEVALTAGARVQLAAAVSVTGTAAGASRVENEGAGACAVTATEGSVVVCPAP